MRRGWLTHRRLLRSRPPTGHRWVVWTCAALATLVCTAPARAMTFSYGSQETLFSEPALFGLGVDQAGDVFAGYVDAPGTEDSTGGVAELPAGSSAPDALPFSPDLAPSAVAADQQGDVFVTDAIDSSVLELTAGSSTPVTLPFTGLQLPFGVAVDQHGDVYVANQGELFGRVLELPAGSESQVVLPFGLINPLGVAVDASGDVFTIDGTTSTVRELRAGSKVPTTLPFGALLAPSELAVDRWGDVFVSDSESDGLSQVLELPAGGTKPVSVPITGPGDALGLAVDQYGDVFVAYYLEDEDPGGDDSPVIELPTNPLSQSITWTLPGPVTYGESPLTLAATASSGLPVSYAIKSGPCLISGSTLTLTGAGACVLTASQGGSTHYAAATPITRTITITRAPTELIAAPAIATGPFTVAYSATLESSVTGLPIPGQPVEIFVSGRLRCSAMTNGMGVAGCSGHGLLSIFGHPVDYVAVYAGAGDYRPSAGTPGS